MILFSILLSIAIVVVTIALVASIIAGSSLLVVFGDLIACGLILWLLVKIFKKLK